MPAKRIGICAPSTPLSREDAQRVTALAAEHHPAAELVFSEQCFSSAGHFAGDDRERCDAFVAMANDRQLDAVWFARGGYGAARIASSALERLEASAGNKVYMGYSDAGNLLGALSAAEVGQQVHGPMPVDIVRDGGEKAVTRALDWLVADDPAALEPHVEQGQKYAAFNLVTLAMMTGTSLMPNLKDHVLMIEEISEYLYAFDRALFNIISSLTDAGLTGLRLGRVSDIPENDRPFGEDAEEIARHWCERTGVPYLGRADIGHDVENKIVPFG